MEFKCTHKLSHGSTDVRKALGVVGVANALHGSSSQTSQLRDMGAIVGAHAVSCLFELHLKASAISRHDNNSVNGEVFRLSERCLKPIDDFTWFRRSSWSVTEFVFIAQDNHR